MNNLSQTAPQTRTFQSWHWIFLATILLVTIAITISTFYFATVQAESHGAITGLTLTSDTPGTLTMSWDAASPTPTDYRVDWAKSDEDYQSWKVDEGHVYPAETATTATITDLGHDTEYKIRMRARYYKGEHEGKSWGGPWAADTITVAGEPAETPTPEPAEEEPVQQPPKEEPVQQPPRDDPAQQLLPAAPSFINTAVSEGRVLLSWSNPSDDSITGYQILRGPDAGNLVVIEDDTESNSTSYTDTAPPAGQTHTYGVKARNASGLGPVGTATAAVPEVLIVARHESSDGTLVSNLGQTSLNSGSVVGTDSGINTEFAIPFTTGANPFGYHVKDVQAYLSRPDTSNFPNPRITIRRDNAGLPGETVLYTFDTSSTTITNTTPHLFEFPTEKESTLKPNIRYWLYVANEGSTAMSIQNTASDDEDTQSQPNWQIGNTWYTKEDGGTWTPSTDNNLRIKISGHAIQQKEVIKLGGNKSHRGSTPIKIGFAGAVNLISTARIGYATSFTPGDDAGWYALSSINFQIRTRLKNLIRVSVHRDDGGAPAADSLYVAYTEVQTGPFQRHELAARFQDNATLDGGSTYWAVFDEMTGMAHYTKDTAKNGNEDAGFESWAIGDTGYKINYLTATGFTWTPTTTGPLLMTFHGYAEPERTLVGAHGLRDTADDGPLLRFGTERITKAWLKLPMGQTFDFCEPTFVAGSGTERSWRRCDLSPSSHHDHEWAGGRGFTTGPNPTGYTITSLGVDMDAEEGTIKPQAAIHSTSAFQTTEGSLDPQSPLANYQAQADIAGSPNSFAPRTGSEEVHLAPNTTYVAYFENDATGYFETPNARAGQDAGAEDGWTLGYPYGSKFIHPLGFAGEPWNLGDGESKRIPLNIQGWPNPLVAAPNPEPPAPGQTLIRNSGEALRDGSFGLSKGSFSNRMAASPFTTGIHGAGYALHGIQIELRDQPVEFVGGIRAAIHSDSNEKPGAVLHELGLQVNLQQGIATFHAPAGTILAASTTYWLVVAAESTLGSEHQVSVVLAAYIQNDNNIGTNCTARGWSIGFFSYWRAIPTLAWLGSIDPIKMAILGERVSDPSVESSEPTCDDLPESTATTGRLIVDGGGVKGQHHTEGDADWYSVDLEADTYYQFTANPGKKGLPYYTLRIFNDQGVEQRNSLIAKKDDAYHSPDRRNVLPFRTQTTGTYYVSIEAWRGNGSAVAYTLAMSGDDYSDDVYTKATFAVDASGRNFDDFQNYLMRTSADPEDSETSDVDWIHVSLKANTTYKIIYDVACLHEGIIAGIYDLVGNPIPNTEAFFKSHEKIRWCSDITTRFTPASDGDYYIAVTARGANFPHRNNSGLILNDHWNPFTGVQGTLSITVTSPPSTAAAEALRGVSQRVTSTPTRETGDTYGVGDAITFELTFSEPVSVSGTPRLRFNIGGTLYFPEYATYVSGHGTATLTFSYTVLAADIDTDGIYLFDDPLAYDIFNDDSIVSIRRIPDEFGHGRPLTAENFFSGWDRTFPAHKVDGSPTN